MKSRKRNWKKMATVAMSMGSILTLSSVAGATTHTTTVTSDILADGDIINVTNEDGIELSGGTNINQPGYSLSINLTNSANDAAIRLIDSTASTIELDATTITLDTTGTAYGIYLQNGAHQVSLGANSSISNGLTTSTGNLEGIFAGSGSIVTVGTGARIELTSDDVLGVAASDFGSKIEFNGSVDMTLSGDDGIAVYADDGGKVIFNGVTDIQTAGIDFAGVNVVNGGIVEFNNDTTIYVPTEGWLAITASGTDSEVTLNGKLTITGAVYSIDDAVLNLTGSSGSVLTGVADNQGMSTNGVLNYNLTDSQWNVNGDSWLTALTLNNASEVSFTSSSGYSQLTTDSIVSDGTGILNMRTKIASLEGDQIHATTLTGDLNVSVTDSSTGAFNANNTWLLAETDSVSTGTITMANLVDAGAYEYKLDMVDTGSVKQYRLVNNQTYSTSTKFVPNFARAAHLNNYAETNSLLKRMGDIRGGDNQGNIWARAFGGEFKVDGNAVQSGFTQDYHGFQVGMDKKVSSNEKRDIYVGAHLGYTKGNSDYGSSGSGDIDSYYGGFYGLYHQPETGFYIDSVLKIGSMKSRQDILFSGVDLKSAKDDATVWALSVETGKRFFVSDKESRQGFYLEPQAKISFGNIGSSSFDFGGTRVDIEDTNIAMGRLGFMAGYEVKSGKNPINVYGKLSWVTDFSSDLNTTVAGSRFSTDMGSNWWVYGVGITTRLNNKHNLYLDLERASGGDFTQRWQMNGGYRYEW